MIEFYEQPSRHWYLPESINKLQAVASYECVKNIPEDSWTESYSEFEYNRMFAQVANDDSLHHTIRCLNSLHYANMLSQIIGIKGLLPNPDLYDRGVCITKPGGWLQVHTEKELISSYPGMEHRLHLIAFLNPKWEAHWGGEFILCSKTGRPSKIYNPECGDIILYEGGFVGLRETYKNATDRVTIELTYLTEARPESQRRERVFLPNRRSPQAPLEVAFP